MSEAAKTKMMRMIQPFTLSLDRIEATDKYAQNKPAEALKRWPLTFANPALA